jgi:hypothetical protein
MIPQGLAIDPAPDIFAYHKIHYGARQWLKMSIPLTIIKPKNS